MPVVALLFRWVALTLLVSAQLMLSACGDPRDSKPSAGGTPTQLLPYEYSLPTDKRARDSVKNSELFCDDPEACPASVGMYVQRSGRKIYTCSGVLVAPDIFVTNRHCVELWAHTPSLCSTYAKVVFAQHENFASETVGCERLLSVSPEGVNQDYAVLKLERPLLRSPSPVSTEGFADKMSLDLWVVDPDPVKNSEGLITLHRGRIRKQVCQVAMHSVVTAPDIFDHPLSPVVALGCEVIDGNSGSGLIDAAGSVRGLVSARVEGAQNKLQDFLPYMVEKYRPVSVATSFSCVEYFQLPGSPLPPECRMDPDAPAVALYHHRAAAERPLDKFPVEKAGPFRWEYVAAKFSGDTFDHSIIYARPTCVLEPSQWPAGAALVKESFQIPRWPLQLSGLLQPLFDRDGGLPTPVTLTYSRPDPRVLSSKVTLTLALDGLLVSAVHDTLNACQ